MPLKQFHSQPPYEPAEPADWREEADRRIPQVNTTLTLLEALAAKRAEDTQVLVRGHRDAAEQYRREADHHRRAGRETKARSLETAAAGCEASAAALERDLGSQ